MMSSQLPLELRAVGQTSVSVTRLGFGAAAIAGMYTPVSHEQALATLHHAVGRGLRLFDTSPFYGDTLSETRVGEALAAYPSADLVISTKAGQYALPNDGWFYDFSYDGIMHSVEASLKRLRCDRVAFVHLHDPDDHFRPALDTAYPALHRLREQGVIGGIGVGMNQWEMLRDFAQHADFDLFLLAGRYTLLEHGARPLIDLCAARGIGLFLGGVFNGGILASGAVPGAKYNYVDAPPEVLERVRGIDGICAAHGVPLRAAALQFAALPSAVTSVIVGMRSPQEVDDALSAFAAPVAPALWAALRTEGLLSDDAYTPA